MSLRKVAWSGIFRQVYSSIPDKRPSHTLAEPRIPVTQNQVLPLLLSMMFSCCVANTKKENMVEWITIPRTSRQVYASHLETHLNPHWSYFLQVILCDGSSPTQGEATRYLSNIKQSGRHLHIHVFMNFCHFCFLIIAAPRVIFQRLCSSSIWLLVQILHRFYLSTVTCGSSFMASVMILVFK